MADMRSRVTRTARPQERGQPVDYLPHEAAPQMTDRGHDWERLLGMSPEACAFAQRMAANPNAQTAMEAMAVDDER